MTIKEQIIEILREFNLMGRVGIHWEEPKKEAADKIIALFAQQKQEMVEEIEKYFTIQGKIVIPEDRWNILKQTLTK